MGQAKGPHQNERGADDMQQGRPTRQAAQMTARATNGRSRRMGKDQAVDPFANSQLAASDAFDAAAKIAFLSALSTVSQDLI